MYRSILVPLDGSTFGEHALPLAIGLARRSSATLHLVHVHVPLAAAYLENVAAFEDTIELEYKKQHGDYLAATVERVRQVAPVQVQLVLTEGEIVSSLGATAERTGADLIVMTTHGRGVLGRFWLGSVADELLRQSRLPLLLVHPRDGQADLRQQLVPRHVLLPLDGSPLAEQMIAPALALGSLTEADYTLLRVIHPVAPVVTPVPDGALGTRVQALINRIDEAQEELRQEAEKYLSGVAKRIRTGSVQVQTKVAVGEPAAAAILREAAAPAIDLVALATHGRRGLSRLFLGSVADKVVRGACVPVLVHRPSH
jgi:nucleotide-binding universal stress UspA family protein